MEFINLKKLEEEFSVRLLEESITKKRDEIRFKVMTDPRITYDQYSELLKGAHLEPVQRCQRKEREKQFKQTVSYSDFEIPNSEKCTSVLY